MTAIPKNKTTLENGTVVWYSGHVADPDLSSLEEKPEKLKTTIPAINLPKSETLVIGSEVISEGLMCLEIAEYQLLSRNSLSISLQKTSKANSVLLSKLYFNKSPLTTLSITDVELPLDSKNWTISSFHKDVLNDIIKIEISSSI